MTKFTAAGFLQSGLNHMNERAATYDKPEGERSMEKTVAAFNAITGLSLTTEQGWLFMIQLKAVRSQQGAFRADSYEDGAAYFGLMGEAAADCRAKVPATFGQQNSYDFPIGPVEGPDVSFQGEHRIENGIGQNGNDGAVYAELAELAIQQGGKPISEPPTLDWEKSPGWAHLLIRHVEDGSLWWCQKYAKNGFIQHIDTGADSNLTDWGVCEQDGQPARFEIIAGRPA